MKRSLPTRRAFTLLEVILALAILGLSAAVLGEACRNGIQNARRSRDYTHGSILCEDVLNEVLAGIMPLENVSGATHPMDANWFYSVSVVAKDVPGLMELRVTTTRNLPEIQHPVSCTLVRWMRDPSIFDAAAAAAQQAASTAASSTSSSSSSSGSSTTGS
jgi:prepilin-type N-terminal cleavage/methylation domain-containing protein